MKPRIKVNASGIPLSVNDGMLWIQFNLHYSKHRIKMNTHQIAKYPLVLINTLNDKYLTFYWQRSLNKNVMTFVKD